MKEVIFVGLPGPTHNYGGLSADNVASSLNRGSISNPKQAALQALDLVRLLRSFGAPVGILPPQLRPHLPTLRTRFSGNPEELIKQAASEDPVLLEKVYSSSAMWAANAATVTCGIDSADRKLHLTIANLQTNLHRRIEARDTHRVLATIFAHVSDAIVHRPFASDLRDEGAANHMRLAPGHSTHGLHVFVYGTDGGPGDPEMARQTLSASKAVAMQHKLPDACTLFVKQNPAMIHEGVFHNDVIAVANESVLLVHEEAYAGGVSDIERIAHAYRALHPGHTLHVLMISSRDLEVDEAVHTYLFNSQIISKPGGKMTIIAPTEVKELYAGKAARLLESIRSDPANPIDELCYADLRQSMNNGGGPACLRLRVPMLPSQLSAIAEHVNVIANDTLLQALQHIVEAHYPAELNPENLADPALYYRCRSILAQFSALMKLPLLTEDI